MVSATLVSPGVSVTISTQGPAPIPSPTTVPLIFLATRANKPAPDGSGIALGTTESNVLRTFTSQSDLLQAYGNIVFVTSDGVPVQTDETNEVGLITAYTMLGLTSFAYVLRAPIDLGELLPRAEPTLPAPDGTYWIDTTSVVGGILTYNGTIWSPVNFTVYTAAPTGGDGTNGDWAFDYSTTAGTLKFKAGGTWYAATTANMLAHAGATNPLYVGAPTPFGASSGDFWYKTTIGNSGADLALSRYQASDQTWVPVTVIRSLTQPTPVQNAIWEDLSSLAATGHRPISIGTGAAFITFPYFVQASEPTVAPDTGTLWFDDTLDFALYVESGNLWVPITTTTVSNPSSTQKVISASAPQFPSINAIWVDVSDNYKIDNYPIVKVWTGTAWLDITANVYIQSTDPGASLVANNSYWLNTGESLTTNIVKVYDPTFVAHTVNGGGSTVVQASNFWRPDTGAAFGRLSQRSMVVKAIKEIIASNQDIRSEVNYYQLIAAPGYPETYDDISSLNQDNGQISLAIFDVPRFVIPNGVAVGREITISDWITDARNTAAVGEWGFIGAPDPFQTCAYPGGLATNPTDGNDVYVPPSYILLRTIAYNDSVAYPWYAPAGPNRGLVTNVASVGYINNAGNYAPVQLNRGQRDIIYLKAINPISNIPNVGLCVWGQKTRAIAGLIIDRINIVRLLAKMKYDLQRLMEPFLFELNNATTRRNATIVAQRYLAGLVSLNALYDYAVLCDGTNNTGAVIASHQLIVDIAIKPEITIEFIYVPILVLNPDQSFPF